MTVKKNKRKPVRRTSDLSRFVSFRANPEDFKDIVEAAKRCAQTLSDFSRQAVVLAARAKLTD